MLRFVGFRSLRRFSFLSFSSFLFLPLLIPRNMYISNTCTINLSFAILRTGVENETTPREKVGTMNTSNCGRRTALTEARKQKGWSMADLAEAVGTDKGYVSHLEKGDRTPSLPMARKICAVLGCGYEIWETPPTTCPSCGSATDPEAKVCFECGTKLTEGASKGV